MANSQGQQPPRALGHAGFCLTKTFQSSDWLIMARDCFCPQGQSIRKLEGFEKKHLPLVNWIVLCDINILHRRQAKICLNTEAWVKWLTFCRSHCQMHFSQISIKFVPRCLTNKHSCRHLNQSWPGPRLNIKTVLSTYGDFHVKDKTAVRTSYL